MASPKASPRLFKSNKKEKLRETREKEREKGRRDRDRDRSRRRRRSPPRRRPWGVERLDVAGLRPPGRLLLVRRVRARGSAGVGSREDVASTSKHDVPAQAGTIKTIY